MGRCWTGQLGDIDGAASGSRTMVEPLSNMGGETAVTMGASVASKAGVVGGVEAGARAGTGKDMKAEVVGGVGDRAVPLAAASIVSVGPVTIASFPMLLFLNLHFLDLPFSLTSPHRSSLLPEGGIHRLCSLTTSDFYLHRSVLSRRLRSSPYSSFLSPSLSFYDDVSLRLGQVFLGPCTFSLSI